MGSMLTYVGRMRITAKGGLPERQTSVAAVF